MRTARPGPVKGTIWNTNNAGLKGVLTSDNGQTRKRSNRDVVMAVAPHHVNQHGLSSINYAFLVAFLCLCCERCFFVHTVSDRVGFGLMDAKKMVDFAVNWTTVPPKVNCTVPLYGVNR